MPALGQHGPLWMRCAARARAYFFGGTMVQWIMFSLW
jgi:hypothetical protein